MSLKPLILIQNSARRESCVLLVVGKERLYTNAHHVVVGLTDDGGVETFGGAFQRGRLWFIWRLICEESKKEISCWQQTHTSSKQPNVPPKINKYFF